MCHQTGVTLNSWELLSSGRKMPDKTNCLYKLLVCTFPHVYVVTSLQILCTKPLSLSVAAHSVREERQIALP